MQAKCNQAYRQTEAGVKSIAKASDKATRKYHSTHPNRAKATGAIAYALRMGRITRKPCEYCGSEKTHAHHDDYRKHYDVRWLCAKDHKAEHRRLEAIGHDFHG